MIGFNITSDKDGNPLDNNGLKLSESSYQPNDEVKKLMARVQTDYMLGWRLQHRPFKEFDGYSLLQRTNMDQETFSAYVGAEYVPSHKKWKFKGRKNTARNKLIGILAHMLAGMLFPFVYAYNEEDEEDKMTARVMRILVEDHLKKADYDLKFLYMVTSALVNPAVLCEVEYVTAIQKVKQKLLNGSIKIIEAVDLILSGTGLNIIPIDQLLLADFYTHDLQRQPYLIKIRRISWDEARQIYAGKYKDEATGEDLFNFVQAGKTRVVMAGQEHQTLFDIEWTEADRNYVQEITAFYKPEDLEVTIVGGVFFGEQKDVYNRNPFKHRRMSLVGEDWISVPIYPFAKSGWEPLDPTGRFSYHKSAAFKEYWDDAVQNQMQRYLLDGTALDVIKPIFMSGVSKIDSTVMVPGATIGMPIGASVTPYSTSPNLTAAFNAISQAKEDMSESTQDPIQSGNLQKGVTAYATQKAEQNARVFLGVGGLMIADLIKQIGSLVMDCILQHTTVGELDATIPQALRMKFRTVISKGKETGKDVTNKVVFTDRNMGKNLSKKDIREREWELFDKAGGESTDQRIYEVNPYKFARHKFSMYIDPDQITMRSMGMDRVQKERAFTWLTDPRVAPYTDPEAVVNDFIIEEFAEGDPDKYKRKNNPMQDMMGAVMGQGGGVASPVGTPQLKEMQAMPVQ